MPYKKSLKTQKLEQKKKRSIILNSGQKKKVKKKNPTPEPNIKITVDPEKKSDNEK